MTRAERRLLINTAVLGLALTVIVAAIDWAGLLRVPELFSYDLRARYCQLFTPPPTDKLIHLDIDDGTLEQMGAWPWPRSKMAEIVDEIRIANAKALAFDVIYSEPRPLTYEKADDAAAASAAPSADAPAITSPMTAPTTAPTTNAADALVLARPVDDDAILAAAIARFGRALVPTSLSLSVQQPATPTYRAIENLLIRDMELQPPQVLARLEAQDVNRASLTAGVQSDFLAARREAMYVRIAQELGGGDLSLDELVRRILPHTDPQFAGSPLLRILREQHQRYQAVRAMRRFSRPIAPELPPLLSTRDEQPTVRAFSLAAATSGYVDYVPTSDGVVRSVPLCVNYRDFAFPQMDLSLACLMLDVPLENLRFARDRVIIPLADGRQMAIPVHMENALRGRYGMFFDVPWFGTLDWKTMYDYPRHETFKQHMAVGFIWEACELRHRIARNNAAIFQSLVFTWSQLDPVEANRLVAHPPDLNDADAMAGLAEQTLAKLKRDGTVEFYEQMDPATMAPDDRTVREKIIHQPAALRALISQVHGLQQDLLKRRGEIRAALEGRAALIGFIAVGMDRVTTSLHASSPGVVVHGAIFNAIMTGQFWYRAPQWVTLLATLVMGLLTTLIVARFSAIGGFITASVVGAGYLLVNGYYLFDYHDLIIGVAAPVLASMSVWSGCTLSRYVAEVRTRKSVKKAFERYVDHSLVDYVMEHGTDLNGQEKELSVVFTDLQGFTTISERLREKTVPLLNEYLGLMVPVIRGHNGYVNKFLGDGIMYMFGAPWENQVHTVGAITSVLEMQSVMISFNRSLSERGLPNLRLRAGITSGPMIVGNAGSPDMSDYTVIGDTVNTAARLESANKVFGTSTLINARARELVGDRFLVRPIGKIQVVGKSEGVMTYEPLAATDKATDEHKRLAELTAAIFDAFAACHFEDCLTAIARLEEALGPDKLTALYRSLCEQYLREPPPPGFDGQITLTEK